jgi:hypothetical protein
VSRFNILFPGETEEALSLLKQAALSHQRKLRELSSHKVGIGTQASSHPCDHVCSAGYDLLKSHVYQLGLLPLCSFSKAGAQTGHVNGQEGH